MCGILETVRTRSCANREGHAAEFDAKSRDELHTGRSSYIEHRLP